MYKVILVDDEVWSLYGLQHLIQWEDYGCEIAGTASNGQAALALCRECRPDLLITDICMPGMDGLELARTLMLEQDGIGVVLVTGYSDIQYAQTALRLGVFDYLIKQVTAEELRLIVEKYDRAVRERKRVSTSRLYFTYFSGENVYNFAECMEQLVIPVRFSRVVAFTLHFPRAVSLYVTSIEHRQGADYALFHTGNHQITCFYMSDGFPAFQECVDEVCEAFSLSAPDYWGASVCADLTASFYALYKQSYTALCTARFWKKDAFCVFTDMEGKSEAQSALERFGKLVKMQEMTWQQMKLFLAQLEHLQIDVLQETLAQAAAVLNAHNKSGILISADFTQLLDFTGSWEEIEGLFLAVTAPEKIDGGEAVVLARKACNYIETHYTEKINLNRLAKELSVNPCYLSTLIRQETGTTYTDIVLRKRMEMAKTLLSDTNLTVMAVAERVGYNEYSHFFHLFRKYTNLSPSQYRLQKNSQ